MRVSEDGLLKKQLSRKEFLQYTLGLVLVIFGINNFINTILKLNHGGQAPVHNAAHGFGASKFGR